MAVSLGEEAQRIRGHSESKVKPADPQLEHLKDKDKHKNKYKQNAKDIKAEYMQSVVIYTEKCVFLKLVDES